ncbi:methyltransferase domain-containing protein [Dehalococcoidia bacterium]|nr:methyltransferase domain-containing protein [Dehalococcoidia bacterium]
MQSYHEYSSYTRYVDFKKLDFIVQVISERFPPQSNACGLDLGCGKGDVTFPLASLGYQMTGIDISPKAISIAESRKVEFFGSREYPKFLVSDTEKLNSLTLSDFVICSEVLEHLRDSENTLYSVSRVLKKGGILVVTVPNGYGLYSLIYDQFRNRIVSKILPQIGLSSHIQSFTLAGMERLISRGGFRIYKIRNSDFISFLPLLAKSDKFCQLDCALANKLPPPPLVSGWYLACQKE